MATIHTNQTASCLQQRVLLALMSNAYFEEKGANTCSHEIAICDLMAKVGHPNEAELRETIADLVVNEITWSANVNEITAIPEWGISTSLASAVISGGVCSYSYSGFDSSRESHNGNANN